MKTPSRRYSRFEKQRRAASRLALYTSLALTGVLLFSSLSTLRATFARDGQLAWADTDFAALPEVDLLRRYVAIDTREGKEEAGADFLAEELRRGGIEPTIERVGDGHANLWAVIEGDDPRALVLHHHIDVDPVPDPELWDFPPFDGVVDGPWLYGRGAFDMKSIAVAQLLAFLDVAERAKGGKRPARSVVFLATSGEEVGSEWGMRWLLEERPELVESFGVVLTEGGWVEATSAEQLKFWGIETAQKRVLAVRVRGAERESLEALADEIRLAVTTAPRHLVPEVSTFLVGYAASRDRAELRELLADPERLVTSDEAFRALPRYLKSLLRTEAFPGPVGELPDGRYELPITLSLLPGDPTARSFEDLGLPDLFAGFETTVEELVGPHRGSPADHPVFLTLHEILGREHGVDRVGPLVLPDTMTDARFLRAAGIPAYGFSPFLIPTPDVVNLGRHATIDERIALPGFLTGVELYRRLLARVTGLE